MLGVLDFISVVFVGLLKSLKLAVSQASVGIDCWVLVVEFQSSVEVLDRLLQVANVPEAAPAVVKVNWVLGVDCDCFTEVVNCII